MPIRKFRDVCEMEGNTWLEPGSPELFETIRAAWDFAERTAPVRFPRGVFKNRSIEEMQARRKKWEAEAFERLELQKAGGQL